jgi:hypothetical protein
LTKNVGPERPHYNKQLKAVKEKGLMIAIAGRIALTKVSCDATNLEAVPESRVTVVALAPAVQGLEGFPVWVVALL